MKPRAAHGWRVYLIACADGSLYTGIAVDVARRIEQHNQGRGARYTRGRGPVQLVAQSVELGHGEALRAEYRIKRLPTADKRDAVMALASS